MRRLTRLPLRQRLLLGAAGLGVLVVLAGVLLLVITQTDASDDQPIAFSHQAHSSQGIECQFCHTTVTKGPVAGIPSVEKCMGCHSHIATDRPAVQKLRDYWADQEPVPWVRVYRLPSYVHFNHASHIAASVSCGSCHGDVGNMTVAEQAVEITMGFCLDCHREQDNWKALYDCAVCHR